VKPLEDMEAGDYLSYHLEQGGIDQLVKELRENNPEFDIEYRNIYTDSVGYLASVEADGYQIAVVDALNGDAMIRQVDNHKINQLHRQEQEEDYEIA